MRIPSVFSRSHFSLSSLLVERELCWLVFYEIIQKALGNLLISAVVNWVVNVAALLNPLKCTLWYSFSVVRADALRVPLTVSPPSCSVFLIVLPGARVFGERVDESIPSNVAWW